MFTLNMYFIGCEVDFSCMLGLDAYKAASVQSDKGFHPLPFAWNRCLLLQKPQLHLYGSQIIDPKPKGRQPLLAFALLFAAIVLSVRKSRYSLSDISIISPFWLAFGSARWVCGDLEEFFWSSAYSVLKRHQEKPPLIFFWFFFFPLLASPKFLYREPAGGPPCRCCFNSATQNGAGQNRLLQWKWGRGTSPKSLQQLFSHSSLRCFQNKFAVFVRSLVCFWQRPCQRLSTDADLEV